MNSQGNQKPALIYFKIRGHAQVIRSVLLEIGVEFDEIIVSNNGYLDPSIVDKYGIEIQNLPYLIHNGNAIHQLFPIVKYLCVYFNRGDLLGNTMPDSIRISQILVKYMKEKNNTLSILVQGLKEINDKNMGEVALEKLADAMDSIMQKSKYFQATEKMFAKTGQYLCGYLTVLDFLFYEKCFYCVNMLTVNKSKGEMAKKFVEFFHNTPFYVKNCEQLSKYKIFVLELEKGMANLLQTMWVGDKKYLAVPA